ncbi:hypothetical protein ACJ5H2_20010 [Nocardioides sp. R1-1]|uniref:hypothetical protein n=1 Tax=Nocardioides sp. R1-1 TaxID=3383502 RepID=UPI0038D196DC
MYFDNRPCEICGSTVELRPREPATGGEGAERDDDHEPDATVDVRVCTNAECPSNATGGPEV